MAPLLRHSQSLLPTADSLVLDHTERRPAVPVDAELHCVYKHNWPAKPRCWWPSRPFSKGAAAFCLLSGWCLPDQPPQKSAICQRLTVDWTRNGPGSSSFHKARLSRSPPSY